MIKNIIIKPINVLMNAALSPDKKIIIKHILATKILNLFNFLSSLKYSEIPINSGKILDK